MAAMSLVVGSLAMMILVVMPGDNATVEGPVMARVLQSQVSIVGWCLMLSLGAMTVTTGLIRKSSALKKYGWFVLALARFYQLVGSIIVVGFDLGDFLATLHIEIVYVILYLHNARAFRVKAEVASAAHNG